MVILIAGLRAFNRGDKARSQELMRYRVLAQGATVAAMMAGVIYGGKRRRNAAPAATAASAPPTSA